MHDQNKLETTGLCNRKAREFIGNLSIIVVDQKVLLIFFPALNKLSSICDNIFTFMSINVHAFLLLSILPVEFLEPLTCSVLGDFPSLWSKLFLNFWRRNIVNDILGLYVSTFTNFKKMKLNLLCKIFIVKNR